MKFRLPWSTGPDGDVLPVHAMMHSFESLGDNCEFGLVQRCAGAEPLGLFRFSGVAIRPLIVAIEDGFEAYGAGDDLHLSGGGSEPLVCRSRACGFSYTISDVPPAMTRDALLARETRKVAYLKRRMLEDMAAGDRILVRKNVCGDSCAEIAALAEAVARRGTCTLLWVREARSGETSGTARRVGETLLEGFVERFAPSEAAYAIAYEPWYDLCWSAFRLATGRPRCGPAPTKGNLVPRRHAGLRRHAAGQGATTAESVRGGFEVFGLPQRVSGLSPRAVHVFSAWVWIPAAFAGTRIGAAIGSSRLGWRDADLALRERWQRVWVGATVAEDTEAITLGLVVSAAEGAMFWSAGWCLEEGPVPSVSRPPATKPG